MKKRLLESIELPGGIKDLSSEELERLAFELRAQMLATASERGGHIASSLGAVELIIGLHRVFDSSKDRLLFDVGHQSYAHKLLTGRLDDFASLRTYGGISGFPKRNESEHDVYDAGHASDSLSIAYGLACARDLAGRDENIVALIGDGAMSGGLAFEALNNIGESKTNMIIVLNDNEMSISKNVGALSAIIGHARLDKRYYKMRDKIEDGVASTGPLGSFLVERGEAAKESVKQYVMPTGMFFEGLGITYVGPVDGHNIRVIEETLEKAKHITGPVLIHAVTRKGKGYKPAENEPDVFHGVGPFSLDTGLPNKKSGPISYMNAFGDALIKEAREDNRIVAITAAMKQGTGLEKFSKEFPDRFYDVGIAEEHAVAMAAGLALGGSKPVVAIYSTFLQRAFDQIVINVALENLPVIFCIDRAGLVGEDGPTHHGEFDLAYLSLIPNMKILAPSNEAELTEALHTALQTDGPIAIRYPRGSAEGVDIPENPDTWTSCESVERISFDEPDVTILAVGRMVGRAMEASLALKEQGINVAVTDMRWVKPIDEDALRNAAKSKLVVTAEEGILHGGFASTVNDFYAKEGLSPRVVSIGINDEFISQGAPSVLFNNCMLDEAGIVSTVLEALKRVTD